LLFDQALTDTPPEVAQIQIDLLRQAGQARRTQLMLPLSQSMFELSWHNLPKVPLHATAIQSTINHQTSF
jgi:hypothetical protein